MTEALITDDTARTLRTAWFAYLDTIEPLRTPLHAYGLRLTGNAFDAEDLVQETLLKGFAMIGRGDLHGPGSPVANARAYLFRAATNLWLDAERRRGRERRALGEPAIEPASVGADEIRMAGEALMAASPQARAAVILKDVFGFSLEEIADQLRTTVGGVKAALRRGREALQAAPGVTGAGPSAELVDRFVAAFATHDAATVAAVLTESCDIQVPGVGGGRGRRGGWVDISVQDHATRLAPEVVFGERVVLCLSDEAGGPTLTDLLRLEEADGRVARVVDYYFCPDTLAAVGSQLGLKVACAGYHQNPETLTGMIATTTLPWGSPGMRNRLA